MLVVGIVLFALGLLFSIAWHELGHFATARRFGVRVPEFMVGFGPVLFSRQRGETSFGVRPIPLGGYIRMIGMVPPAPGERVGRSRRSGPFQGLIDDVRADSARDIMPGDEDRQFWTRKPWQRIVVMFAGPFMNLILAAVLFIIVLMGFGIPTSAAGRQRGERVRRPGLAGDPGQPLPARRAADPGRAGRASRPATGS